jgi:hypothetical protein
MSRPDAMLNTMETLYEQFIEDGLSPEQAEAKVNERMECEGHEG